ncbi:SGNH/GDSL hydrolase family protein [Natronogracilivirga saccharolytica]|uniref:SGNH/GDSL hydrolase family protein n=1 Tax=Natronogracilivirga saccharolytica TaxID=2812953 RepID=A0A8J7S7W1_9BACT|nr:SGNH/GDSL hydrolase family protein [Natronogracilivirga saccharolytica]MBP3193588.1 SGNH/GDSL hydrolase family protein [Natronogracilivirga saccharolytica]
MKQEEKEALLEYLVQFSNIEKRFPLFQGIKDAEAVADFIGLDSDQFQSIRNHFDEQAKKAAEEILKDEKMLELIESLPIEADATIAVVGDAITDDRQGWFQIFRNVLEMAVPKANYRFIDASLGESLSSDALRRLERDVIAHKPDWIFVALGSQDAQRLHLTTGRTLVSLAEFWENINAIESAILQNCDNPPVWITPPPVISELMQQMPLHAGVVLEEDLKEFREVISGKSGYIVDPAGKRMGSPPDAWNFLNDGFHPSLAGNTETVKSIIKTFAEAEKQDKGENDGNEPGGPDDG